MQKKRTMKNDQGTVTVSIGEKEFSKGYTKKVYENVDDVLGELQDAKVAEKLIANLNYATDLKLRASVRAEILTEQAGPEKSIEKQVQAFIKARAANGKPVTEEQARKMVAAFMEMEAA